MKGFRNGNSSHVKVLVVDDDEAMRCVLRHVMLEHGEQVVEATNGLEAIAVALHELPDAVLLDWYMPVFDGPSVLPELRRILPVARIVMLPSMGGPGERRVARAAGADAVVDKVDGIRALLSTLEAAA